MKKVQDFKVERTEWLNENSYILELSTSDNIEQILPGNFAELKIPNESNIFLRRPLSFYDVDYKNNTVSFFIKVVGPGTKKLSNLNIGETVNIIYPLGNSYSIKKSANTLIVGGGSGIAPFKILAEKLITNNSKVTFLFGARSANDVVLVKEFSKYGDVLITTEDGSVGEKGLVTDHSVFNRLADFHVIYTCGPDPMMKAVSKIGEKSGIKCEASLENMMACGIGACLCCVTKTTRGNECVCTEGPVFNSKDLLW